MDNTYMVLLLRIIIIIQITPKYFSKNAFNFYIILSVPHRCNFFMAKMHHKRQYLYPHNPLITNKIIIILLTHAFSLERFFPISHP